MALRHSDRAKAAGMDSARKLSVEALDPANVAHDTKTWELVVRKLRAGMMPPAAMKRPDPPAFEAMIASFEADLDRASVPNTPAPGLHRLNRTEYENVVRDLLDLDIDAAKFLPSDDSTAGFDNIAGALGISSTLVEAYVSAAQKISRLAMGYPEEPTLAVYRTREDTSQNYHIEGLPFGTRGGLVVEHPFPSDGEYRSRSRPSRRQHVARRLGSVRVSDRDSARRRAHAADGWRAAVHARSHCGPGRTRPRRAAASRAPAFFGGRAARRARAVQDHGGHAHSGRDLPRPDFATAPRPGSTVPASTVQDRADAGYTFFPHVGNPYRGTVRGTKATASPSRRIFVCTPKTGRGNGVRGRIVTNWPYAYRRPATAADGRLLDFYEFASQERTSTRASRLCCTVLASPQFITGSRKSRVGAPDSYRSRRGPGSRLSFPVEHGPRR